MIRLCVASCVSLAPWSAWAGNGSYIVERFEPIYAVEHEALPGIAELLQLPIPLAQSDQAWVGPAPGLATVRRTLGELGGGRPFDASAIAEIGRRVVDALNRRGLVGVFVAPSGEDVDLETGEDLRPAERRSLRLVVWVGRAIRARTISAGYGVGDQQGVDRVEDRRILARSPVKPDAADARRSDLLTLQPLEDYVYRLNRYPRRQTRLALTSGSEPATVNLEYQIFHERPWSFYAEASNNGTDSTGKTRHRIGFLHHQLTGNDDTLHFEYLASRRAETQAFVASYEAPVPFTERFRWRIAGSWSEFNAEDLGFSANRFEGIQSDASFELIGNVFQSGRLFVDVTAGVGWQHIEVDNDLLDPNADSDANFILPQIGARLSRYSEWNALAGDVRARLGLTNEDEADLAGLGRFPVEDSTLTLSWNLSYSSYVEPWIALALGRPAGDELSASRVHELRALTRGQLALGDRLIPQHQLVVGGASSVRGYPQSSVAGDEGRLASLEYRLHMPRLLPRFAPIEFPGIGSFAYAPRPNGERPEWDLVFRVFFDVARVRQNDRLAFESDESLAAAGFGLELTLRSNLRAQFDCGQAMRSLNSGAVDPGDRECHASATIVY